MRNSFEKLRITIYLVMCMLITFLLFAYLNEVFVGSTATWWVGSFVIAFVIVSNYFLRKYVTNFLIFLFAHLILISFPFILPIEFLARLILAVISFSYLIMGINYWKLEENEHKNVLIETPLSLAFLFILAYIHSSFAFSDALTMYAYLSGVAYFILYYTREYLDKFRSMSLNTSNNKSEILGTFSTNFSLVLFLNVIIMAAISISYIFYSDNLINRISALFKKFFRYIFSLFLKDDGDTVIQEIETTAPTAVQVEKPVINNSFADEKRDFPIIDLIFEALVYVVFIVLFCAIVYIIYLFIKQYLNRNRDNNDVIEKITANDVKQKVKKKKTTKNISIFTPNDIKLRKIYTRKVNDVTSSNSDIILLKSFTSDEICSNISKDSATDKDKMTNLTELYKKARYSNHPITKFDVDDAAKYTR